ncbi:MAG: rod shape-determining protein MreC [Salinibacter sp.]
MDQRSSLVDWGLLAVLLLASVSTMAVQNESLGRAVRAEALELTAQIESTFAWMGRYIRVLEENDELRRENITLSSEVARTRSVRQENEELEQLLRLRDRSSSALRAARIVTKDIFRRENTLTLDVGQRDSVAEGMPVVHESGIVGSVTIVSEKYAQVMPYLNTDFRVAATILPIQADGIVRWDGERMDRLILEHVVKTEPVEEGQRVVTSGHSDAFPPGRAIGTIDSVATQPGRSELQIYLRPAVSLPEIRHAFVVLSPADSQRQALESSSLDS